MFGLGFGELLVILVIALVFFGPGKLPEVGEALGKGILSFRKALREVTKEDRVVSSAKAKTPEDNSTVTQSNNTKDARAHESKPEANTSQSLDG
jgi:sec-independent protein translocase protein TatA